MSGNADAAKFTDAVTAAAKMDRRILRTRDKLGDALVALMQEKAFDAITVQQVLDRAAVGRSTFYVHFRDKDDLFLSDVEDFLGALATMLTRRGAAPDRIAPVREFCAHLADVRDFHAALIASGKIRDVWELGQEFFARSIKERLVLAGVALAPATLNAQAHALAGTLFALLTWWLEHGMTESPEAMDKLFHGMVWGGVSGRNSSR